MFLENENKFQPLGIMYVKQNSFLPDTDKICLFTSHSHNLLCSYGIPTAQNLTCSSLPYNNSNNIVLVLKSSAVHNSFLFI